MIRKSLLATVLLFAAPSFAATNDPTHIVGLQPGAIEWTKAEASDHAWPIGDQKKPGPCMELVRWHPGHFSHPHFHSRARYAVVLDGTWWVSSSDVYDPDNNTVPYPKGSVLTDLAKGVHYDGAKPQTGDATIAIFSDCPLESTQAEKK